MFSNDAKRKAKERLERARIRTQMGVDVSDDSVVVELPKGREWHETFADVLAGVIRWIALVVVFAGFFIGVISVIVPETRAVLVGIWNDSMNNLFSLIGK